MNVWKCQQNIPDSEGPLAVSSRQSGTTNRKRLTAVCVETMAWYRKLMTLSIHQVRRSLVLLASVHRHTQLVPDSVWDVEPIKLVAHETSLTGLRVVQEQEIWANAHETRNSISFKKGRETIANSLTKTWSDVKKNILKVSTWLKNMPTIETKRKIQPTNCH